VTTVPLSAAWDDLHFNKIYRSNVLQREVPVKRFPLLKQKFAGYHSFGNRKPQVEIELLFLCQIFSECLHNINILDELFFAI
jgi:hypothetical protein